MHEKDERLAEFCAREGYDGVHLRRRSNVAWRTEGADTHVDLLHFETAYYAGIERAIERELPLFEAGAQGEHKLLRGFEPCPTYSAHWIRHPGLAAAIAEACAHERAMIDRELAEMSGFGPYRGSEEDA